MLSVSNLVGSATRVCVCVFCVECDPPQTGVSMWGGLRRPMMGPFQVTCVLAAAVLAAAFSISSVFAQQGGGHLPLPDKPNLGGIGERINSNTIAVVSGNLNATNLSIAYERRS